MNHLRESIERHQKQLENPQSQVSCYLKIIQLSIHLWFFFEKFCWT